jgi:hypothetical protein
MYLGKSCSAVRRATHHPAHIAFALRADRPDEILAGNGACTDKRPVHSHLPDNSYGSFQTINGTIHKLSMGTFHFGWSLYWGMVTTLLLLFFKMNCCGCGQSQKLMSQEAGAQV